MTGKFFSRLSEQRCNALRQNKPVQMMDHDLHWETAIAAYFAFVVVERNLMLVDLAAHP